MIFVDFLYCFPLKEGLEPRTVLGINAGSMSLEVGGKSRFLDYYWLTCFSIPMRMSFWINSLRRAKESLLGSSIYHIVTLMTLSLSIIKDLRSSFLIFTPKNSQFLKPQNLPQLLLISICFSPEIRATTLPPNYLTNVMHLASTL